MSRVGKQVIDIPANVEVSQDPAGRFIVKGPHGSLERQFDPVVDILVEAGSITFKPRRSDVKTRALWGTYASHVANMIQGVVTPYQKKLIVEGVGYKANVEGADLVLAVGFSHPVKLPVPSDLSVEVEKNVISITGINKESVGAFAGKVRAIKKPEPYKGKGIRYEDEVVKRKQGKKSA